MAGAFQDEAGGLTFGNLDALTSDAALTALKGSLILSASTAVIGAVLGAVLAYFIVSLPDVEPAAAYDARDQRRARPVRRRHARLRVDRRRSARWAS